MQEEGLTLESCRHRIRLDARGHEPFDTTVDLPDDERAVIGKSLPGGGG